MARYSVSHQTAAGSDLGLINLAGAATIRVNVYDVLLGSDATPADQAGEFVLNRTTATGGGGTSLTEVPLDPLTVAATGAATGGTFTTQPTDTANTELLMIAFNQRATFRWVAAPGSELISTASANNGLFLRSVAHSATPNINATLMWFE